jgi:squalene-hopene/tetraprenyl-beta-curcumene cyclase
MTPQLQATGGLVTGARAAIRAANDRFLSLQSAQGYWWALLTADTTLESDYILLQLWLHPPKDGVWSPPNREQIDRAVRSIVERQLPDGGFNVYPDGPADVSATTKAYFALKLCGVAYDDPRLARARAKILELGGMQACNSYVKVNLSLFGLYPREYCPSVPPEMMLLPGNVIYRMSSWTRAIVLPLAVIHAMNPRRPVPSDFTLEELFLPPGPRFGWFKDNRIFTWRNVFLAADRVLKVWERYGSRELRLRAIRRAEQWMLERTRYSDGLGAIYPPMMYLIMALDLLGYGPDHPDRIEAERQFNNLMVDDGEKLFFQPCFSVVWDTAIIMYALGKSGAVPEGVLHKAADWVVTKEVRRKGDWSIKRPNTQPSGWYFEFANEYYPDIDDTAMVLLGLSQAGSFQRPEHKACIKRAVSWLLDMQSADGGWAAFDVDNNWDPLSHVPFADHNAMLDPTCPDITGRVLEALCVCGVQKTHPAVLRAIKYLMATQEPDGSWYGRWGVNYVYGTFLALRGLRAAGVSDREACVLRAGEWIRSNQNADGGWGESCASYDQGTFMPAPSTPSQTAWAVLGLLASGDTTSQSLRGGVEWLVRHQREDGGWEENLATGTGFPRVFYLSYTEYRNSFPLLALGEFLKATA